MGKKIGKLSLKILGGLVLLFLLLLLILRFPAVQTKIANVVTKRLSKQLNTHVSIDRVAMNFLDNATVKGIYIEDQQKDTLLYAQELSVDIAFFKIFRKIIEIDRASLQTGVINISENQDSVYNFQFLVDAFASADTTETDTTSTYRTDLNYLRFSDVRMKADLLDADHYLDFDDLKIGIEKFDLDNEEIISDLLVLDGFRLDSRTEPVNEVVVSGESSGTSSEYSFPLSALPFRFLFHSLRIRDAEVSMKEQGFALPDTFDSRYIDISNFELGIENLAVNPTELSGLLKELKFNLNDRFTVEEFTTAVLFTDQELSLKGLLIDLQNSELKGDFSTRFSSYQELVELDEAMQLKMSLPKLELNFNDLSYFLSRDDLGPFFNKVLRAKGTAEGSLANIKINDFNASAGNTRINLNGRLKNILDSEQIGVQDLTLDAKADYEEYALFITDDTLKEQLKEIGDIQIKAKATGNATRMQVENLEVYTEALAEARFSGLLQNLTDTEKLLYDVQIHHITTGYNDMAIFVDSLPEMLAKFDTLTYSGYAQGDLYDIVLEGGFSSSLGNLNTDLELNFNSTYEDASYEGRFTLKDFQIGELLDQDSLGRITLIANIDGRGMETDSIIAQIDALISEVEYNSYRYQNIEIDGRVKGLEFSGLANVDDENIRADFAGLININDSIPVMNFALSIDTLNLEELHFSDSVFHIQLDVDADIAGLNPDNADGKFTVRNIQLSKKDKTWTADSIELVAMQGTAEKGLHFKAPFMLANVEGDYQLSLLPDVLLDFLDQYFPLKTFLGRTAGEDPILDSLERRQVRRDVMAADIRLFEIEEFANFFDFPIQKMDTALFEFALDVPNNLTQLNFVLPRITYDGYYVEGIEMTGSNDTEKIESNFSIDSVSLTESVHLGGLNFDLVLGEQSATLSSLIRNQKNEESLGFSTRIRSQDSAVFLVDIVKDFILNNQVWDLEQEESIRLKGNSFDIPIIRIQNEQEAFTLSGTNQKLDLNFTDFNLNNLIEVVGVDSLDASGLVNGHLEVGLDDQTPISGDLRIKDINFNEFNIGDLVLDATKEGQDVSAVLSLEGEEVKLDGNVGFDLSSNYIFGRVLVDRLNLEPFNPFVQSYAQNLEGAMQGYVAIDGQLSDPDISGALYFQEVEAYIVDLGTVYRVKEGKINVLDGLILPDATLEDNEGRLSHLKGEIRHDFFSDITFDLDFDATEFKFLDSKQNKSEYFYGVFVGKVDAKITGTSDLPIIDADITALEGTDFTVQLLSSAAVLTQEDYMVFYDGKEIDGEDAIDSISMKAYQPSSSMELNLELRASDDALFHVIVDPVTGDRLDIRGNTDLAVNITADDDLRIVGEFLVSEGRYRVSYENTIRRTFDIEPGSRIVFMGNPYNAGLDIRAIYSADVNTTALLELTGGGLNNSGSANRTKIDVVLNVGGVLSAPDLAFNIVAPNSGSSPVGNEITNALAQLRQNETLLLEQVGSIILFNSFIGGNSGGNITNVGTSTAVNSVGNLINSQLNKLASKTDGFEIDFNIDQYQSDLAEGQNITEFGIGLQQKLFNDRLVISAGGNANLETGQAASNNFSSFAGDFVIQYLLTENGKFRVKVFQKSDFNALNNSNIWKTGVGLSYKTQYGQVKPKK